jgi:formylglycine-generating enzyme required for sulfatase activity
MAAMADIFVCYRREDAQWSAGRINDKLVHAFGADRVFFDTITIKPGQDFVQVLGAKVGGCRVLLAIIGPNWLDIMDRTLGDDNDFVRIEIMEALERNVHIVPVLIDGARQPPADRLPEKFKALSRRQAVPVRAETFHADVDWLIAFLKEFLGAAPAGPVPPASPIQPTTQPKPGTTFKDIDLGPEMVVVPAGEFMMGSGKGEVEDDELPQHEATIKNAFAVGISPVTRGEFAAFIGATNHKIETGAYVWAGLGWKNDLSKSWRDPGFQQGDDHPVVCVDWHDAQAYVAWLTERSGKAYRLLSEAEWEYCCRAGTTTAYSFGDKINKKQAQFEAAKTIRTGSFSPNAWGLHDMHGNVWEWCEDNWHPNSEDAPQDGSVWKGGDKSLRVLRGGSWRNSPHNLRSANRVRGRPGNRSSDVGFRVARTL